LGVEAITAWVTVLQLALDLFPSSQQRFKKRMNWMRERINKRHSAPRKTVLRAFG